MYLYYLSPLQSFQLKSAVPGWLTTNFNLLIAELVLLNA